MASSRPAKAGRDAWAALPSVCLGPLCNIYVILWTMWTYYIKQFECLTGAAPARSILRAGAAKESLANGAKVGVIIGGARSTRPPPHRDVNSLWNRTAEGGYAAMREFARGEAIGARAERLGRSCGCARA